MSQKLISTAILIAIMCQLSHQNPTSKPSEKSMSDMYTECSSSRCFAMPDGCISKLSCDVLLAVTPSDTGADFMMFWNRNSSGPDNWVGAALSEDKKMGNDSVTECILEKDNTVLVRQGLTYGGDKYGVNTVEPVRGITKEVGNVSNSIVSCSWSRVDDTMVKTLDFNILNEKYYVFLAYGPMGDKDQLKHHSNIWISEKAEYLAKEIVSNTTTATPKPTTPQPTTSAKPTPSTSAPPTTTSAPKTTASGTPATTGTGSPMTTNNSTVVSTNTPSNMTTPSNTTSSGNNTTPNPTRMTTTGKPSGSATITFSVLLAIFVTIIFSLNL